MVRNNAFEIILSAVIIMLAVGFLAFMRWQTGTRSFSSYQISARVPRADRLDVGTDVRIGGVTIGRITRLSLEPRTYRVKIDMDIRSDVAIPDNSRLDVSGAVMSSPYLTINPGHHQKPVPQGGSLISQ